MSPFRPLVPAGLVFLTAALLIGCTTFADTGTSAPDPEQAEAERTEPEQSLAEARITVKRTDNEAAAEGNVRITAAPPAVRIYINGAEHGTTPLTLSLPRGSYRLAADKELHYRASRWIDIRNPEKVTEIEIGLPPKRGTFSPRLHPADSTVTVSGTTISSLPAELPAGSYTVRVKRFGYRPLERTVHIRPAEESSPVFDLEPAPFSLQDLRVEPPIVYPHDPGPLGEARVRFALSGPARVEALLYGPDGKPVFSTQRTVRSSSGQYIRWSPASPRSASLPQGLYRVELAAESLASGERRTAETYFELRHAPRETLRANLAGGTPGGTLLSPTALLPHRGSGRLALITLAGAFGGDVSSEGRSFPQLLSAGWSIDDLHHLGLMGGLRLHESASPVPRGSISYAAALLRGGTGNSGSTGGNGNAAGNDSSSEGPFISAALNGRYAHRPGSAALPGLYHGLGAGASVTLHGALRRPLLLSLSLSPELQLDPRTTPPETRAVLRGALALETPRWEASLSAALRSSPFGEAFEVELPLAAAAELRAMLPGSPAAFSLLMLTEAGPGEFAAHAGVSVRYYFSLPSPPSQPSPPPASPQNRAEAASQQSGRENTTEERKP